MPLIHLIGIAAVFLATACRNKEESESLPLDLDGRDSLPEVKPKLEEVHRQLVEAGIPDRKIDCGINDGRAYGLCQPDGKIKEGELWQTTLDSYAQNPENEQLRSIVRGTFKEIAHGYYGKGLVDHFALGPCSNIAAFAKALLYDAKHQSANYYFGYCSKDPYFLRQAIVLNPEDKQAWQALTQVFMEQGLFPEAKETVLNWLQLDPKDGNAHKELGSIYVMEGKLPQAEHALEAAAQLQPLDGESHALLGLMLLFRGEQSAAEKEFLTAGSLDPAVNLALVSFLAGERLWDAAKRHLILLEIQMPELQNEIGGILFEIEREQMLPQPKAVPLPKKIPAKSLITL